MQILQTNLQLLAWISGRSFDETIGKRKKVAFVFFSLVVLSANLALTLGSLIFIVKFVKVDFESSLCAIPQMCHSFPATITCVIVIVLRNKIFLLFDDLEKIYGACKNLLWLCLCVKKIGCKWLFLKLRWGRRFMWIFDWCK